MSTKKSLTQALRDAEKLQKQGIHLALPALAMLQQKEMQERGVKQFWRCNTKGCGLSYESFVNITWIKCPKDHPMKMIWQF